MCAGSPFQRAVTILALWTVIGCTGDERHALYVNLRTDLVPVHEFSTARIFLQVPGTLTPRTAERRVVEQGSFVPGSRVAEFGGLEAGDYRLVVELRDRVGGLVTQRPVSFKIRRDYLLTVVITRDCRNVTCDDPGRSACLQGVCVSDSCTPETPELCPAPSCVLSADCPSPAATCAEAVCADGICFTRSAAPQTCAEPTYCDPELGCRLPDEIRPDAGALDSGPVDAGAADGGTVDAGAADSGTVDARPMDSGALDAGATDSGTGDAGATDAGTADAGPPPPCMNGIQDGLETGVDCGPSCTVPCSMDYDCAGQTDVSPSECWALVDFYSSTDGARWTDDSGWLVAGPCTWRGVTCAAGHVDRLELVGNRLNGSLAPSFGALAWLTVLDLSSSGTGWGPSSGCSGPRINALGVLPAELGRLSRLEELHLQCSGLSGAIPPEVSGLVSLRIFDAIENLLTGGLPAELGSLANLTDLRLSWNRISGPIPPQLGNMSSLDILSVGGNLLSGTVPPALGNLSTLNTLVLSGNVLIGSIPPEIGGLTNLTFLELSSNQFTGRIPPELGSLGNLTWLGLANNRLSNDIPAELGNLTSLTRFDLSVNMLTSAPPAELGNLVTAHTFDLSSNQLSGVVPPEFMSISGTLTFWLRGNGCLTASGAPFLAWLVARDPLWNDGC